MEHDLRHRIHDAANAAWNDVWATVNIPDGSGELTAPLDGVVERADDMYRRTVRDHCSEVGVDERCYWLASPEQAVIYRPACVADQLEQMAADLLAAGRQREREFFRTHPPF